MSTKRVRLSSRLFLAAILLATFIGVPGLGPTDALANGADLTGQRAPDMSFRDGLHGLGAGSSIAKERGKVVLLFFWLRDCPHCRKELPRIQRLHNQFAGEGLSVFTVVHKFNSTQVQPVMRKLGYQFPVACDLDGSQAKRYSVGRRPVYYLIDVDGVVRASNRVSDAQITGALGTYRLRLLGQVPSNFGRVRQYVQQDAWGPALREAEGLAASQGSVAGVPQAAARVRQLASAWLERRAGWIARIARGGNKRSAISAADNLIASFKGTSLLGRAQQIRRALGS